MLVVAVLVGVCVGITVAVVGGGGAALAVPALVYLLGVAPRDATTVSLAVVAVAATIGLAARVHKDRVRVGTGLMFAAVGLLGTYIGSAAAVTLDGDLLMLGFAGVMVTSAGLLISYERHSGPTTAIPDTQPGFRSRPDAAVATAVALGAITGLFGVGAGAVAVPALVLVVRLPIPAAVTTSQLVIVVNGVMALMLRWDRGDVLVSPVVLAFGLAAALGALGSARIDRRLRLSRSSRPIVALLMIVAAAVAGLSLADWYGSLALYGSVAHP